MHNGSHVHRYYTEAVEAAGGSAARFDALIKSELKHWPQAVKDAGITAE
jgi:hypothetical protein